MGDGDDRPSRKGDRAFIARLVGAAVIVAVVSLMMLNVLDRTRFGDCAARGFQQVTDTPSSD